METRPVYSMEQKYCLCFNASPEQQLHFELSDRDGMLERMSCTTRTNILCAQKQTIWSAAGFSGIEWDTANAEHEPVMWHCDSVTFTQAVIVRDTSHVCILGSKLQCTRSLKDAYRKKAQRNVLGYRKKVMSLPEFQPLHCSARTRAFIFPFDSPLMTHNPLRAQLLQD